MSYKDGYEKLNIDESQEKESYLLFDLIKLMMTKTQIFQIFFDNLSTDQRGKLVRHIVDAADRCLTLKYEIDDALKILGNRTVTTDFKHKINDAKQMLLKLEMDYNCQNLVPEVNNAIGLLNDVLFIKEKENE